MTPPDPKANERPGVWPLVIDDMKSRQDVGLARYGVALQPFNRRDALNDAYEECLDMAVYLRQAMEEDETYKTIFHELLSELVYSDSLGVHGSSFQVCRACRMTTEAGSGKDVEHETDCPVAAALARAVELEGEVAK